MAPKVAALLVYQLLTPPSIIIIVIIRVLSEELSLNCHKMDSLNSKEKTM